jgi:DNA-binding transcriptional LysR family regulator
MDTNRIRYFLSLARAGSITKAAELHHISAAAFSKAMKVFESEVGRPLTMPHGRGIILTDYARTLVPALESIVRQIDSIKNNTSEIKSTSKNVLKIATFEVFSTHFMSKAIRTYFPDYRCEIYEMIPGKMEEAVMTGKVDLALTYLPIPHSELDFLRIQEVEMGVYGTEKLANQKKYERLPFVAPIGPVEGSPNKVRGLDGWPDDALPRNIIFHVEMLETALGLCREGLAVAYLPKFVVNLHNDTVKPSLRLQSIMLPPNFPKRKDFVYLIKRKSDQEGNTAKKMARAIRTLCGY